MVSLDVRCKLLLVAALGSTLGAQELVDVYVARPGETVFVMSNYRRGVAVTRGGSIWVLVTRRSQGGSELLLIGSKDGGRSFDSPISVPTAWAHMGSIVADLEKDQLHVVWEGASKGRLGSLYHQRFSCDTTKFLGTPECLLHAKGADDQFHGSDLELTRRGDLCLTLFTHRSPDRKVWKGGWSGGLMILKKAAKKWSAPRKVNVGFTGIQPGLQVVKGDLYFAYRSFGGSRFGLYFRSYDPRSNRFLDQSDLPIMTGESIDEGVELQSANTGCLGADQSGNLYLLYAAGSPSHKKNRRVGQLRLAFASRSAPGKFPTWKSQVVSDDRAQLGGNTNPVHFCLSRGPADQLFAIYSLASQQHRKLYSQVYDGGTRVARRKLLAESRAGAFAGVTGMRSAHVDTGVLAVVHGTTTKARGGRVALVVRSLPVRSFWMND